MCVRNNPKSDVITCATHENRYSHWLILITVSISIILSETVVCTDQNFCGLQHVESYWKALI